MDSTALIVQVPEAEHLVQPFREHFDSSAPQGMPAHITILYPCLPAHDLTPENTASLRRLFAQVPCFSAVLMEPRAFPGCPRTLYLAPVPIIPFSEMTYAVQRLFPAYPPYGGVHVGVFPHLTVAQSLDPVVFDQVAARFCRHTRRQLPMPITVTEVSLWNHTSGRWTLHTRFPLQRPSLQIQPQSQAHLPMNSKNSSRK